MLSKFNDSFFIKKVQMLEYFVKASIASVIHSSYQIRIILEPAKDRLISGRKF